jgi:GH35 family endo-1,4-beta-xylanase
MASSNWRAEADKRIEKHRKGDFAVTCTYAGGKPAAGAKVTVRQMRSAFHFGTAVGGSLLWADSNDGRQYARFILDHFNTLVCENAMKWYAVEREKNKLTFDEADRLMKFAEDHGLAMRGHCLFWGKPKYVQAWVRQLTDAQLREAVDRHLADVAPRYRGRLIAWDVNNEMLDGSFYLDRLGKDIRAHMFRRAAELDPCTPLFLNEYGVLCNDEKMRRYIELASGLRAQGAKIAGIGVQEHAAQRLAPWLAEADPNKTRAELDVAGVLEPWSIWRRLDKLGELGAPIHITEVSSKTADEKLRADTLETFLRVAYAHPKVDAFMFWGFWAKRHWLGPQAALVDADWKLLPAGQRVSKMLREEWRTNLETKAGADGAVSFRGFQGAYEMTTTDSRGRKLRAEVNLTKGSETARAQFSLDK